MTKNSCKSPHRIFIAGPHYNNAEKVEQAKIALLLEQNGFTTFLPQRDGFTSDRVVSQLISEGRSEVVAQEEASQIIHDYYVYHLIKSSIVVSNMNGIHPDAETVAINAIAYSASMPVIFYRDDERRFSNSHEIVPFINAHKSLPTVRRIGDIPKNVIASISKVGTKSLPDNIKEAVRAGSQILPSRFRKNCKNVFNL